MLYKKSLNTFLNNNFDVSQKLFFDNLFYLIISIICANQLDESTSKTYSISLISYNGIKVSKIYICKQQ